MSNKYLYVSLSQNIDSALSLKSYQVAVTYQSGLEVSYFGSELLLDLDNKRYPRYIFKGDEIKSVIFDGDLEIETVSGKINLTNIFNICTAKNGAENINLGES